MRVKELHVVHMETWKAPGADHQIRVYRDHETHKDGRHRIDLNGRDFHIYSMKGEYLGTIPMPNVSVYVLAEGPKAGR